MLMSARHIAHHKPFQTVVVQCTVTLTRFTNCMITLHAHLVAQNLTTSVVVHIPFAVCCIDS